MTGRRLLVFDLDGTLLGTDHRIPNRLRSQLLAMREVGIETTLATGRPYAAVGQFIDELELRLPLILFNGAALVEPDGGVVSLQRLPIGIAREALRLLRQTSAANHLYMEPADTHLVADRLGPAAKRVLEKDGMPTRQVDDLAGFLETSGAGPIKIFSIGPRDELERVQKRFRCVAPDATCVFSEHDMLEVLAPGVTKGRALQTLCDMKGIDIEDVTAFGDNLNDLEMLRVAGHAVAMPAAPDAMIEAADVVTDDLGSYLDARFGHLVGKDPAE
jgi:Cof subfamily protein (haloacid dehalogenase superfamily)